jgi:hypothetical protein
MPPTTRRQVRIAEHEERNRRSITSFLENGVRDIESKINTIIAEIQQDLDYQRELSRLQDDDIIELVLKILHNINRLTRLIDKFESLGQFLVRYQSKVLMVQNIKRRSSNFMIIANQHLTSRNNYSLENGIGSDDDKGFFVYMRNGKII